MESVQQWFDNGCDYRAGVALYASLKACKPVLLRNFEKKETAAMREKLKYELGKLQKANAKSQMSSPRPSLSDLTPGPSPKERGVATRVPDQVASKEKDVRESVFFHQLPAELRPVLLRAHETFRENCLLKVELNELVGDLKELTAGQSAAALQIQLKIHDNFKENALCWKMIDHWRSHRQLPQPVIGKGKFDDLTGLQVIRRQQQLFSSISRLNKRLESNRAALELAGDVGKRVRLERSVARQEANLIKQQEELQEITKLINGKNG